MFSARTDWWKAVRWASSVIRPAVENEPPSCSERLWKAAALGTICGGSALSTAMLIGTNSRPRPMPAMMAGPSSELKSLSEVVM